LAVLVAVVGVFVWRGLRHDSAAIEPMPTSQSAAVAASAVQAPAVEPVEARRAEPAPAAEPQLAPASGEAATGTLSVYVVELETGGPVAGTGLTVQPTGLQGRVAVGPGRRVAGGPHDWLITDSDGHGEFTVPAGTAFTVLRRRARFAARRAPDRRARAQRPAERTRNHRQGPHPRGSCASSDASSPTPTARRSPRRASPRSHPTATRPDFLNALVPAGRAVEPGPDGLFEVTGHSWRRPLVRIQAEGFAPAAASRRAGTRNARERVRRAAFSEPASLRVHAIDGSKRRRRGRDRARERHRWSHRAGRAVVRRRARPADRAQREDRRRRTRDARRSAADGRDPTSRCLRDARSCGASPIR
jgi:hypothetical protein